MLNHECNWTLPSSDLSLSGNDVHVWRANIDLPISRLEELERTLCDSEKARAGRFVFDADRRRYIAGRGFLRLILGRYIRQLPEALVFSYSPRGKPELVANSPAETLYFNVSHSHDMALYAVSRTRCVGIDIEHIAAKCNVEQLAKRYFFPREFDAICAVAPERKNEIFFKGWTVKEAYVKATGEGLAALEQVELAIAVDGPAVLQRIHDNPDATGRWSSCQLSPAPGYIGALVVEGKGWDVKLLLCL